MRLLLKKDICYRVDLYSTVTLHMGFPSSQSISWPGCTYL